MLEDSLKYIFFLNTSALMLADFNICHFLHIYISDSRLPLYLTSYTSIPMMMDLTSSVSLKLHTGVPYPFFFFVCVKQLAAKGK